MRRAVLMLMLAATAAAPLGARDYRLRETTTVAHTLRFGGSGPRALDLRNLHGSIRVTAAAGDTVELRAQRTVMADTEADMRRGEREAVLSVVDGLPEVEAIVQEPNGPICGTQWEGGWSRRPRYQVTYDFTVSVPARTRLRLCTINGSDIEVTGTTGDFDVTNVNGRVTMTNVRGSGSATTVNGRLSASFLDAPREDAQFKTVNGDVVVTWPGDLAARLRLKTFNGGLFTDFAVTPVDAAKPSAERRDGRFVYRSRQFTDVQIGRGGPTIVLETLNGDVRVLRGSR